jgi:hypothetical protein
MSGILQQGKPQSETVGRVIPAQAPSVHQPKENFEDIFDASAKMRASTMEKIKDAKKKDMPMEESIEKMNKALSGQVSESKKIEKELEDLNKFSDEDIKLAEELLFNGHAKKTIKLSEKVGATFYSTNAAEISLINELMYEFTKKYESTDGRLDVSQKTIDHMNQLYMLTISFKGYDDKELSSAKTRSLDLIKSAFKRLSEFEIAGEIDNYKKLSDELKVVIKARAAEIKNMAGTILDALSFKRYQFERDMYDIITRGDVIPK